MCTHASSKSCTISQRRRPEVSDTTTLFDDVAAVTARVDAPILVNLTEFGVTPYFTLAELREAGVALALYPLSAARAGARAMERVYEAIRRDGTQANVVGEMQTRDELYDVLDYLRYEQSL